MRERERERERKEREITAHTHIIPMYLALESMLQSTKFIQYRTQRPTMYAGNKTINDSTATKLMSQYTIDKGLT